MTDPDACGADTPSAGRTSRVPHAARSVSLGNDLTLTTGLTIALVLLLVISSVLGLLYGGRGWYHPNPFMLAAFLAQDAVTLVLAVPLLMVSAWLARRGSIRGGLCWMGTLFYVAYSYYFYVVGARVNIFFLGYVAIVSLGMYGTLALLFSLDVDDVAVHLRRLPRRITSAYFVATALFFASLWLAIALRLATTQRNMGAVTRTLIGVDGIVLLPLLFYAGVQLWRRQTPGYVLAIPLLLKTSLTFLTLTVSTLTRLRWGRRLAATEWEVYLAGFLFTLVLLAVALSRITREEPAPSTSAPRMPAPPPADP